MCVFECTRVRLVCVPVGMHVHAHGCVCVLTYGCMRVSAHVCGSTSVCMGVYVCACAYTGTTEGSWKGET